MTAVSDNKFPKVIVTEGTAPSSPSSGDFKLYVDSSDHLFKMKNSSGTVTTFGTGLSDPMTTRGDIIIRNSSNSTARLAVGSAGKFLTSDGTDIAYGQGPLTTTGDLLIGATGGTPTRLAAGSTSGHVLTSNGSGAAPSWQAASGGGGITQTYVGYNTIGGSQENVTDSRIYATKVTLANDCLLTSIACYVGETTDNIFAVSAALFADNSGAIGDIMSYNLQARDSLVMANSATPTFQPAWMHVAMGVWLTAGDYWLGVMFDLNSGTFQLYYDGSGSDRYFTPTGYFFAHGSRYSQTNSTRKYSIRGHTIR